MVAAGEARELVGMVELALNTLLDAIPINEALG